MVKLIDNTLNWWNITMTRLGCAMYGHIGNPIEVYSKGCIIKNYVTVKGKIIFVPPYKQIVIYGKQRCAACGAVYLGNNVKEEQFQDTPQDTP